MARDDTARVNEFAAQLERVLGPNVLAMAQYGEAVRGELPHGDLPLNLLIILRDAAPAALRPVSKVIADWVRAGNPAPLIFSETEWRDSTDVFPIEIEDMREAHRLVHGEDPFTGLTTTLRDLRQELERELRGKLLQLRAEFAAVEADAQALTNLIGASALTFLILFRALLRLRGTTPPATAADVMRSTAELTGFDAAAFDWALAKLTRRKAPRLAPYDPIAVHYVAAIEAVTHYVNAAAEIDDG